MERYAWPNVVFGVERHVPCEPANEAVRHRRARIVEHVADKGEIPVFSKKVEAQEWLANEDGDDPNPKEGWLPDH